jgi:S1-C subfamily serine protease
MKLGSYGPSIAVLATVGVVLWLGPVAVEEIIFARTEAEIIQASERLEGSNLLEDINRIHRDIATRVEPSVVYISTTQPTSEAIVRFGGPDVVPISSGSGWVFDAEGHIVTNAHVIDSATQIEVQLDTGELRHAEVVGVDSRTDIAVLKISPENLHPATRGNSLDLRQGDQVFAFGSPFDFRFSMSQGIVSGVGRDAQLESLFYQNFIQVDAAINPGNSGGPLTDIRGRVVGMNTAIATGRQGSINEGVFSGIGLAIPMEMIESVVSQLIEKGEVSRGFIGVQLQPEITQRTTANGFVGEGVEVLAVHAGGPAEQAGLESGDVITEVDGVEVATRRQIQSIISARPPGESLSLTIWRFDPVADAGRFERIDITLAEMAPDGLLNAPMRMFLSNLGFARLSTATAERAQSFRVTYQAGVIIEEVVPGSGVDGHIELGSIITHVFDDRVRNLDDFYFRVERASLLMARRGIDITVMTPEGREHVITLQAY